MIDPARARLIERVEAWDERAARLFACDCAERVVGITGSDARAVAAIAVARRFAVGEATEEERAAAESAADDAADDAAARADTWAAARAAVWAASSSAARAADRAAEAAAWAAARAAADDAAGAAERSWQSARLLETLGLAELPMLDPARPTVDFRRPRREGSVPRVAARCRPDWVRFATWSAITAVVLAWVATLFWLLVQGVAWALDWLT